MICLRCSTQERQGKFASICDREGGQCTWSPGDGAPKQRKLHYRRHYLHLDVAYPCRRVSSGSDHRVVNRVLGACPGAYADEKDHRAIGSDLRGCFCAE